MTASLRTALLFLLGMTAILSTGCTSMGVAPQNTSAVLMPPTPGSPPPGEQPASYSVIFQPTEGRPEGLEKPLTQPTSVQQVIEQTDARKKFRRIEIVLVRPLPKGGFHRIPCEYDRTAKRINPEYDYALMPGDKVLVKEDPSTVVDDILNSASGNLVKRMKARKKGSKYQVEG